MLKNIFVSRVCPNCGDAVQRLQRNKDTSTTTFITLYFVGDILSWIAIGTLMVAGLTYEVAALTVLLLIIYFAYRIYGFNARYYCWACKTEYERSELTIK
jgi:hypothetical protein